MRASSGSVRASRVDIERRSIEAACLTPQEHYGLPLGRLRPGDPFNAALDDDLLDFQFTEVTCPS